MSKKNPIFREDVIKVLKAVYDPEIPVDIWELGLIYDISIDEENNIKIAMTLTAPNCPAAQSLPLQVHERVKQISGVGDVDVEVVWDPPWHPSMMSEVAKLQLGYM
ncbi:MAG: SUF system Fe-S cluster assembly protein [Caldisericaceae bacterium]|nr:SUF system Fe-S cluster assembly protein [Caldisericaceae bacterium]